MIARLRDAGIAAGFAEEVEEAEDDEMEEGEDGIGE